LRRERDERNDFALKVLHAEEQVLSAAEQGLLAGEMNQEAAAKSGQLELEVVRRLEDELRAQRASSEAGVAGLRAEHQQMSHALFSERQRAEQLSQRADRTLEEEIAAARRLEVMSEKNGAVSHPAGFGSNGIKKNGETAGFGNGYANLHGQAMSAVEVGCEAHDALEQVLGWCQQLQNQVLSNLDTNGADKSPVRGRNSGYSPVSPERCGQRDVSPIDRLRMRGVSALEVERQFKRSAQLATRLRKVIEDLQKS